MGVVSTPKTPPIPDQLHPNSNSEVMIQKVGKIIIKKSKVNKKGLAPLAYQIFIEKEKVEVGMKISCKPESFNEKTQRITELTEEDKFANLAIIMILNKINSIIIKVTANNTELTKKEFLSQLKNPQSKEDFLEFFLNKANQKLKDNQIEDSTFEAQMVKYRKMKRYKEKWPFAKINDAFIEDFIRWLKQDLINASKINGKPQVNGGINTLSSVMKVIKTYLNEAKKDKIRFEMPDIKLTWNKTSRTYLTFEERQLYIDLWLEKSLGDTTKQQALEMFLFSCSTGLRISDIKRLRTDHIINGVIHIVPHKTKKKQKEVIISCNDFVVELLKDRTGKIFPTIAEQTINEKLKEITFQLGLNKNVSMHVGRHTFATLYTQLSPDIKALSDILGHSSIVTTQQYLHVDEEHIKKAFKIHNDTWKMK